MQANTNSIKIGTWINQFRLFFFRLLSAIFMVFAVNYWLLVIGYYGEGNLRFDTMEIHWRIASSGLSVLLPIVALGLWGGFAWAPAVWLIAIIAEMVMYGVYPDLFGERTILIWFHILCVILYLTTVIVGKAKKKAAR